MKDKLKVLIIEDHPLIAEAYKNALLLFKKKQKNISFSIDHANNCKTAIDKIGACNKEEPIDIVFLDIKLPPSIEEGLLSGEDVGLKIKHVLPKTKIVIATSFNDNFRVHSLIKTINPDGFLIKSDVTPESLAIAIETIIFKPPYYSSSILKLLRKEVTSDLLLDKIDRHIIYELSRGTKMKELPSILPLSKAGIEKRKRHLKEIFNVKDLDDKELIQKAREKGFI